MTVQVLRRAMSCSVGDVGMRIGRMLLVAGYLKVVLVPGPALAAETQTYTYDARGRLVKVERSGTVNNGVKAEYTHDKANNRTEIKVTGSSS